MSQNPTGTRHIVLYEYDATNPSEVSIKPGQIVYVLQQLEKGWVHGEVDGKQGMFPADYVQIDTSYSEPPNKSLPDLPSINPPSHTEILKV